MIWTSLDTWIVITGILSALSCALLGNFMVLRRLSMMGDAISHAVLPGLAIAFFVTGSRESPVMFVGAAIVGVLTAAFTQSIHHLGRVDESASMGIVFTTLFAIGLILIVRGADSVDLDPGCVLYGAIEMVPLDTRTVFGLEVPRATQVLLIVLLINIGFVVLFFKELEVSSFDPALATTMGINSQIIHYVLMTLVAITTVASFESVGSILVVAMIVVPGATAHLLTDRLSTMIIVSAIVAAASAALGHLGAITIPTLWGFPDTNTAGMIAVTSGALFFLAMLFAPRHGIVSKALVHTGLGLRIARDDILGILYRNDETKNADSTKATVLASAQFGVGKPFYFLALLALRARRKITYSGGVYRLTDLGRAAATSLIRTHRLWESYLFKYSNLAVDHLHFSAHQLEHATDLKLQDKLADITESPSVDPHGKSIPPP